MKLQLNKSAGGFYWDNISKLMWSGTLGRGNGTPRETWWSFTTHFQYGNTCYWYCDIYYVTSDKTCQTWKVPYAIKRIFYSRGLIRIGQGFWGWFHNLSVYITSRIAFPSVIFTASSCIVDAHPRCICPYNPTSTRSQSTSLLYRSTSDAINTPSTSEKRSPLFYLLTTTSTSSTGAPASLGSSVCYCLCSTTSSKSYLLGKYSYRNRLA